MQKNNVIFNGDDDVGNISDMSHVTNVIKEFQRSQFYNAVKYKYQYCMENPKYMNELLLTLPSTCIKIIAYLRYHISNTDNRSKEKYIIRNDATLRDDIEDYVRKVTNNGNFNLPAVTMTKSINTLLDKNVLEKYVDNHGKIIRGVYRINKRICCNDENVKDIID